MDTNVTKGSTFQGIAIQIDAGMAYHECHFINCQLIFAGVGAPNFLNCTIDATCKLAFVGPAGNTISFLKSMYAAGSKDMIEQIFRDIRSGIPQPAVAPAVPAAPSGIQ